MSPRYPDLDALSVPAANGDRSRFIRRAGERSDVRSSGILFFEWITTAYSGQTCAIRPPESSA